MMSISQKSSLLVGENYYFTFNQSIQHLLSEIHKETSDWSHFIDTFYQLMQSKVDPPLESIWAYSALSFKSRKTTNGSPRELFRFISGCSGSCSASKSIALLAPVVFEVYILVNDLGVKKTTKEVNSLIGAILGYISVCCSKGMSEESDSNFSVSVTDLVSIWMDGKGDLKKFLPLISDEMRREISDEFTSVNSFAGVVMFEVFLLKLCLDLRGGIRGLELENELKKWIVGSITGFQSFYFYETLVKTLLEPALPVDSLLSPEDASFLRKILYDAAILVEYSFLRLEKAINLPADRVRSLAVKRLIITSKAIEYFRKNGDRKRAISYTSSFSNSQLHSQIVKFFTGQIGVEEETISRLKGQPPKALIRTLLFLDGQGMRIFDDRISKSHAQSVVHDSMSDSDKPALKAEGKKTDAELQFFIDNGGGNKDDDGETNMLMNDAFVAAAHTMRNAENVGRKRKDGSLDGRKKKSKLSENPESDAEKLSSSSDDGSVSSDSESEVENPISDEDVE
ncbi:uncharacterized protein [Euphorbia lathyris]|uniref:uncharacterized protein n=1 Tax=Euphorbia lathyris TaxID=212925 RepID=UPI00331348F5